MSRQVTTQNMNTKNRIWEKRAGHLMSNKTLGIIGLGTIGKALVRLSRGFNFRVLAFDINADMAFANEFHVQYCDLDTIFSESDILSIHLNLNSSTRNLLNFSNLKKVKDNCILINTSRGEVIDENALLEALKSKKILGAGLDVFNEEPYSGPLCDLENVVLTPHIGSYAKELRVKMEDECVNNLIRGLRGK